MACRQIGVSVVGDDDWEPAHEDPLSLHTMVRVLDLEKSIAFYRLLGLEETRRNDNDKGRFTTGISWRRRDSRRCPVELTYNWDGDDGLPSDSRHFGASGL